MGLALVAALAPLPLSGAAARATPANLVLIVVDTLRADRLGAYGWREPTSPRIDALAASGVLFEEAHSHAPQTQPSFSSILTGTLPLTHGVRANGMFYLRADSLTLAEILRARGYQTGAVVGGFPLDSRFKIDQGFETYFDEMKWNVPMQGLERDRQGKWEWAGHHTAAFESSADQVTDEAIAWLGKLGDAPFFLMVHYFDPHHDYIPPEDLARRFSHPYAGEVAKVDRELARLLDALEDSGRRSDTLVAFTADHGECLGEHGRYYHLEHVTEATIHVPLILSWPDVLPAGVRVEGLVRSIDIAPTLLDLLEVPVPDAMEGETLRPAIARGVSDVPFTYFETLWGKLERDYGITRHGITDGRWKLIRQERPVPRTNEMLERYELYDLKFDPEETRDLSKQETERLGEMRARLERFLAEHPPQKAGVLSPDPDTILRLKALGYL